MARPGAYQESEPAGITCTRSPSRGGVSEQVLADPEMAHLDRVTLLGGLCGSIAHELNQPLTAILSNARALQTVLDQPVPDLRLAREIVGNIIEDCMGACDLIVNVRVLLRRDRGGAVPVAVNSAISEVIALEHSELVGRNTVVRTLLASGLPRALADKVEVQQIVLNLLLRACDSVADLAVSERLVTIITSAIDVSHTIRIQFRDRGASMSLEQLRALLDPQFSAEEQRILGTGLAISRAIAHANGGCLWGENNLDDGSSIVLDLPMVPQGG
jgi:two-component system, LuxR family, sensor kinase FixL